MFRVEALDKLTLQIRLLEEADIDAAMRLKELANWNQTRADWQRMLRLAPRGCFAAVVDGRVVGTVTTAVYDSRLAWIGMVLVDPEYRRRGIASRLMTTAHEYLNQNGVKTIKLDATPDGQKVYEAIGYQNERLIERWLGVPQGEFSAQPNVVRGQLDDLLAIDLTAFGVSRFGLLQSWCAEMESGPLVVKNSSGGVEGYALTRPGAVAAYAGPLVAVNAATAERLLNAISRELMNQQVYVDLHADFPGGRELLTARGFVKQRDLFRMFRGEPDTAGTSATVMAIGGPELG